MLQKNPNDLLECSKNKKNGVWSNAWNSEILVDAKDIFSHPLFLEGYETIRRHIRSTSGALLEAGGGTGRYGIKLACENKNLNVNILDIAPESISLGKKLAHFKGVDCINFIQGDINHLPFQDCSFDCVVSDAVIQVFEDFVTPIGELARVLKPGGIVVIAVVNYWNIHTLYKYALKFFGKKYIYGYERSFTRGELKNAILRFKLKIVCMDGFAPGYGASRHNRAILKIIGSIINIICKAIDLFTRGWASKFFGFEIVMVAIKH